MDTKSVMNTRRWIAFIFAVALAIPLSANDKKTKEEKRGLIEKMEAVPCGASQKGLSGLGALWASAGITKLNTDEKLCPQYLLRTDEMDYEIRPTDLKHATILPVGQEGEFHIAKNEMLLRFPDADDRKLHAYQIVQMDPVNTDVNADKTSSATVNDSQNSTDR
jgi:hypothetical protein